jgi:hypothetical protein
MAQFIKHIQVDNVQLEFWFTGTTNYRRSFFVTVEDKNMKFHSFHMEEDKDAKWKIVEVDKVPSWIMSLEDELSKIISKNIRI